MYFLHPGSMQTCSLTCLYSRVQRDVDCEINRLCRDAESQRRRRVRAVVRDGVARVLEETVEPPFVDTILGSGSFDGAFTLSVLLF